MDMGFVDRRPGSGNMFIDIWVASPFTRHDTQPSTRAFQTLQMGVRVTLVLFTLQCYVGSAYIIIPSKCVQLTTG